jgi:molecular chaperone DnaK
VKDADAHAEEDKKKKELIDVRNQADAMAYSVEKNIKEFGDKVDAAEKARIEEGIAKVKKAIEGDDIAAIKAAQEELTNASHKLAEAMYAKTAGQQTDPGAQPGADGGAGAGAQAAGGKKDDDVVDADFEDVKK